MSCGDILLSMDLYTGGYTHIIAQEAIDVWFRYCVALV